MSAENHIKSLESKKVALEKKLEELQNSPSATDVEIAQIKKEKLKIKDQIAQFAKV